MTAGYEPRFDRDYRYGRQGELLVADLLTALAGGQGRVEVKRKRRLDSWLYVELMQDPGGTGTRWKDSGLNVTESEWWAHDVADTGVVIFLPTDFLRWVIRRTDHGHPREETDGNNPTRGRLLRVGWLLDVGLPKWHQHSRSSAR